MLGDMSTAAYRHIEGRRLPKNWIVSDFLLSPTQIDCVIEADKPDRDHILRQCHTEGWTTYTLGSNSITLKKIWNDYHQAKERREQNRRCLVWIQQMQSELRQKGEKRKAREELGQAEKQQKKDEDIVEDVEIPSTAGNLSTALRRLRLYRQMDICMAAPSMLKLARLGGQMTSCRHLSVQVIGRQRENATEIVRCCPTICLVPQFIREHANIPPGLSGASDLWQKELLPDPNREDILDYDLDANLGEKSVNQCQSVSKLCDVGFYSGMTSRRWRGLVSSISWHRAQNFVERVLHHSKLHLIFDWKDLTEQPSLVKRFKDYERIINFMPPIPQESVLEGTTLRQEQIKDVLDTLCQIPSAQQLWNAACDKPLDFSWFAAFYQSLSTETQIYLRSLPIFFKMLSDMSHALRHIEERKVPDDWCISARLSYTVRCDWCKRASEFCKGPQEEERLVGADISERQHILKEWPVEGWVRGQAAQLTHNGRSREREGKEEERAEGEMSRLDARDAEQLSTEEREEKTLNGEAGKQKEEE
ncbi:hypothetical protein PROFUN_10675 [Planoprotostelium fungivorum]|uniref:Uncharacterized protein n=1 Tax=Planoprotostelium fungivorum TaxID=1890364 RepID=A0A2P6MUY1_9EUKA|nr:hypothetical protein PROFUN_10675 [Planoprotostelium fungivorum]